MSWVPWPDAKWDRKNRKGDTSQLSMATLFERNGGVGQIQVQNRDAEHPNTVAIIMLYSYSYVIGTIVTIVR